VPEKGYYEIVFPDDISFDEAELLKKGKCIETDVVCEVVKDENDKAVEPFRLRIQLPAEAPKK